MSCSTSSTDKHHLIGCFKTDSTHTTSKGSLPQDQCIAACRTDGFEYSSIKNNVCECSHSFGLNGVAQTCASGDDVNSRNVYANFALYQAGTIDPTKFPSDVLKIDQVESKEDCLTRMTRNGKQLMTFVPPDRQHVQIIRATYGSNCPTPTSEVVNGNTITYNTDVTVELQAKIQNQSNPTILATLSNILSASEASAARLVSNTNRIPDCTGAQLTVTYTCDGGEEITKTVKAGETMTLDCTGQGKCYIFGTTGDLMNNLYSSHNIKDGESPLISQPNLFGTNGTEPIYVYPNYTDITTTDLAKLKTSVQELQQDLTQAQDQYTQRNDLLQSFEKGSFNFFNTPCTIQSTMDQVRQAAIAAQPQNVILKNTMSTLSNMVSDYSARLNQFIQTTPTATSTVTGEEEISYSIDTVNQIQGSMNNSPPLVPVMPVVSLMPNDMTGLISRRNQQIKSNDKKESQQDRVIRILKYGALIAAILSFFIIMAYYIRA